MRNILEDLVGKHVIVYSVCGQTSASDSGILEAYDENWIRLKCGDDTLVFSIHLVRLVKLG